MKREDNLESYVSFETAKKMVEKGFNKPTLAYTYGEGMVNHYSKPRETDSKSIEAGRYPLPTTCMATAWLFDAPQNMAYSIEHTPNGFLVRITSVLRDVNGEIIAYKDLKEFNVPTTLTEAVDAAINHCLDALYEK